MTEQLICEITSIKHLKSGVHLLEAKATAIATSAHPGQFVMVRCGAGYDPYLRRPFSIHRMNRTDGTISLLFTEVGRGTRWLAQRQPGDTLDIVGPLGNGFVLPAQPGARLLLVAGGMGIAPLVALTEAALARGHSVTLLHGAATVALLYPEDMRPTGLEMVVATEDGTAGVKGMVSHMLPDYVTDIDSIFVCGPMDMYRALGQMKGLQGKSVQVSLETRMGCGLGACFGCTIDTRQGPKRICQDGPVFELSQII